MQNNIKIDTSKNNVVTGRSLLSSSAKILNEEIKTCRYLEYKTFIDFLESVIFHDNVYIIGKFNDRENNALNLMNKLNNLNKTDFIFILDDTKNNFIINETNVDVVFKEIVNNTFSKQIQFIRKQLFVESYIYRYNDDEKTSFLNKISNIDENKSVNDVISEIKKVIINLHIQNTNSEFVKHLFRAFEIAAVSKIINGTAKFTGSRKPIGFLIRYKNKNTNFKSLTYRIYHYVNYLYLKNQKISASDFYVPLIFKIFLMKINEKNYNNYLETIIELRNEFSKFRSNHILKNTYIKKRMDKEKKELKQTFKYFSEIYELSSNTNFISFIIKLTKKLLINNENINIEYEYSNEENEDNATLGTLNYMNVIKNFINLFRDYYIHYVLNKKNKPLSKYFVKVLSSKDITINNELFKINEFQKNKMKKFDEFIKKYKI